VDLRPDLAHARVLLSASRSAATCHAVVVSSTAVYGATPNHPGLAAERRAAVAPEQSIARAWAELESIAADAFADRGLTVLRAAPAPDPGGRDFYSRLFASRLALTVMGHDPTLQVLSLRDLARAIALAARARRPGIFNVVPAAPVTLRTALRAARCRTLPAPWLAHRAARALVRRSTMASSDQLQFVRYHLTAAPEKSAYELGFEARDTSLDAIGRFRGTSATGMGGPRFDPFGLDRQYIESSERGFMGFMRRRYWRVEMRGLEHVPEAGAAVLVGLHRGFMPFDGVMTVLGVLRGTGRVVRFLIHPGVGMRFPFLFNFMSKFGGVIACHENADRVLTSGQLLGVYPEGIRGAFTPYDRAHRVGPSWRNDCVAFAIRHRVPIVPFVTLGSAEIFPILGRIKSRWWKAYAEWPFIPITPTFPLVPVPLPSKWHTLLLEPLQVGREYPPEAADDPAVVKAIGAELRTRMETALAELRRRRRSIFAGSVFRSGQPW
jgi:1-acyl-sn-glycerol-3-phosphate acyltransferase